MFPAVISNSSSVSENQAAADFGTLNSLVQNNPSQQHQPQKTKKKRNLPGNPDPDAEVIALSPKSLMATNRFVCEVCNKGFQRDQNLQLHRRGHNLPWKLKQRNSSNSSKKKRAYVCPETSCVHHHPSRALGDLTGIKKHYCRKHGEKKWKCDKCSKIYAVHSDWKAHSKTCGTREYTCDCGTLFSRKDSFVTHRAFCDALAEESARLSAATNSILLSQNPNYNITTAAAAAAAAAAHFHFNLQPPPPPSLRPFSDSHHRHRHPWDPQSPQNPNYPINSHNIKREALHINNNNDNNNNNPMMMTSPFGGLHAVPPPLPPLSATALLQKAAAAVGSAHVGHVGSTMANLDMHAAASAWQNKNGEGEGDDDRFTRDFLGLTGDQCVGGGGSNIVRDQMLTFTGGVKFPAYDIIDRDNNSLMTHHHGFGFTY